MKVWVAFFALILITACGKDEKQVLESFVFDPQLVALSKAQSRVCELDATGDGKTWILSAHFQPDEFYAGELRISAGGRGSHTTNLTLNPTDSKTEIHVVLTPEEIRVNGNTVISRADSFYRHDIRLRLYGRSSVVCDYRNVPLRRIRSEN